MGPWGRLDKSSDTGLAHSKCSTERACDVLPEEQRNHAPRQMRAQYLRQLRFVRVKISMSPIFTDGLRACSPACAHPRHLCVFVWGSEIQLSSSRTPRGDRARTGAVAQSPLTSTAWHLARCDGLSINVNGWIEGREGVGREKAKQTKN